MSDLTYKSIFAVDFKQLTKGDEVLKFDHTLYNAFVEGTLSDGRVELFGVICTLQLPYSRTRLMNKTYIRGVIQNLFIEKLLSQHKITGTTNPYQLINVSTVNFNTATQGTIEDFQYFNEVMTVGSQMPAAFNLNQGMVIQTSEPTSQSSYRRRVQYSIDDGKTYHTHWVVLGAHTFFTVHDKDISEVLDNKIIVELIQNWGATSAIVLNG